MTTFEILSIIVSAAGSLFVGISVLLLVKQLQLIISAHTDNHEWNRRIATQQAVSRVKELNNDELNKKFGYINRKESIPLQEVQNAFKENPALQLSLHKLLNIYEGLANGVFLGTYDEATIKASQRTLMEKQLIRFRHYISYRRDSSGNQKAWAAYERLNKKWNQEMLESHDREPTGKI